MHSSPVLLPLVTVIVAAMLCGGLFHRFRQPAIVGYIVAGVALGPQTLGIVQNTQIFDLMGQFGLMFLLFYIGAEVDPGKLISGWKISVLGCLLQIAINVGVCFMLGWVLKWNLQTVIFIGFVTSLSSTAVVLKILEDTGALESDVGKNCLGILLVQDFAVVPMLIILGLFGPRDHGSLGQGGHLWMWQLLGTLGIAGLLFFMVKREHFHLPSYFLAKNKEFKILSGLLFCLGAALITGFLGLSAELGAFLAGLVMGRSDEGESIKQYIQPFKVFFVCVFFVSIGLLFDVAFFQKNFGTIFLLVLLVLVLNSFINAGILRFLGVDNHTAIITGILLSQIGEFSFLLAATGKSAGIIESYGYQMTISTIVFTLLLTPFWLNASRKVLKYSTGSGGTQRFTTIKS